MNVLACLVICCAVATAQTHAKPPLRFNEKGTFKIVQFTDLHFGESLDKDTKSQAAITAILGWEKPDMVMLSGDAVSGYAWPSDHPAGWFKSMYTRVAKPLLAAGIPWAYTLGNHDREADLTERECIEVDMEYNMSLTQLSPEGVSGGANYWLDILSRSWDSTEGRVLIMDSGHENCEGIEGWGCAKPDQVEWYRETSALFRKKFNKTVPVVAYFHIPIPEYMNMWNNFDTNGTLQDSGVCCFSTNTGLYAAFKEMGEVMVMSVGHDHTNDYIGDYYGITLAYGRKSGFGGYFSDTMTRGARVIQMFEGQKTFDTWIRQDDGTVVQAQPLHKPGDNKHDVCCGAVGTRGLSNCDKYVQNFLRWRDSHAYEEA